MMDYRFVEAHRDRIVDALDKRGIEFDLAHIDQAGKKRKETQVRLDDARSKLNDLSAKIGKLHQNKEANAKEIEGLKSQTADLKKEIASAEMEFAQIDRDISDRLLLLPNLLHESVRAGKSAQENIQIRTWGDAKKPVPKPKNHDEIGESLGILDFSGAAKVSGARFAFLKGWGARLERALINMMMDLHASRGYTEIWPPFLIGKNAMVGSGQLPKFEAEAFRISDAELYLAPTSEVPVVNFHREQTLTESELPIRYVAYSPCFRREAGSYGKDTKGLIRQHQFDKVELIQFTTPETSYAAHEALTDEAEEVLRRLELPYRVLSLCSADIGFAAAKTYDLEVWLPGQGEYREISSCSNCEEFQARRADIRYKPTSGGKPQFVHTLNGSGLAVGRTLIAILENGQRENGSVALPKVLAPYLGGTTEIPAKK